MAVVNDMELSIVSTRKRPVPAEHRTNFNNLVFDIAWFGVLNGSAIAFIAVYATRIGATGLQVSLLTAIPAVINLMFALPAGRWLQDKPISRATVITAILNRWFYLIWVILPLWLAPTAQIWVIVVVTLLMSIPGTALAISFNALFAAAVPPDWRAQVVGVRNAAYALSSILVTLVCGWMLNTLPFPLGYQVVFLIGVIGAVMSTIHLSFVRPVEGMAFSNGRMRLRDWAEPGIMHTWNAVRTTVGLRFLMRGSSTTDRPNRWLVPLSDEQYKHVLVLVFAMHLALYLAIPLFPLALVRQLGFADNIIAVGNGVFYAALFIGSLQHNAIFQRLGNRRTMALGMMVISIYPLLVSQANGPVLYWIASIMGGLGWSLAGAAVGNYVLQETPEDKRPAYLAWYNIALQAGILLGSLVAPMLASAWSISTALMFAAFCRFLIGILAWRNQRLRTN
ncbi:MAG: MFS transporter [Chloroflexota bacterium]